MWSGVQRNSYERGRDYRGGGGEYREGIALLIKSLTKLSHECSGANSYCMCDGRIDRACVRESSRWKIKDSIVSNINHFELLGVHINSFYERAK